MTVFTVGLVSALFSLAARTPPKSANPFVCASIAWLIIARLMYGSSQQLLLFKLLLPTALGTVSQLYDAFREEESRRRISNERMRLARDLHDVVAHPLVLAKLQAGAMGRLVHTRPAEAEHVVAELTGTTAAALTELRPPRVCCVAPSTRRPPRGCRISPS